MTVCNVKLTELVQHERGIIIKGIFYGIGVGSGEPELLTLKAVRIINECEIITAPKTKSQNSIAFDVIKSIIDIKNKNVILFDFPMTQDKKATSRNYKEIAKKIEAFLDKGQNVAMLTLGDVCIYSTSSYILDIVKGDGYDIEIVSGIPSFCSVAAKLQISLTSMKEPIHIIPALHDNIDDSLMLKGTKVFMKSGSLISEIKEKVEKLGYEASVVVNCGLKNERVFESIKDVNIEEKFEYFTTIIVKD